GRTPGEARTPPDERMLCVALGVVALLGLAGGCGESAPHNAVSRMLHLLEGSAGTTEPPNPSVLLALNLAGAGANSRCKLLLQQLQETAVERAPKDMTSGELALYTLALLSSCQSPRRVQALGHTVDLLRRLQERTDEEVAYLGTLSLDVLALCLEGTGSYEVAAVMLAKEVLSPGSGLSVGDWAPPAPHVPGRHPTTAPHIPGHRAQLGTPSPTRPGWASHRCVPHPGTRGTAGHPQPHTSWVGVPPPTPRPG
uniref:Uncharacterized protein n=1 Tax=Apteryx owenii TaxID=8824 RepID=A0A8B9PYG4_APTOW